MPNLFPYMEYQCVRCRRPLNLSDVRERSIHCQGCGHAYEFRDRSIRYEFESLLFDRFKEKYLLNKVLNNNAYLSYHVLKDTSISLPNRPEVMRFRDFILANCSSGKILDVGCGILECPGYLDFKDKKAFEFYGIDPIDSGPFFGTRVVGCSEFMPFPDGSFDTVVFATSLDHVCSPEDTLAEAARILVGGGKALVWMSDSKIPFGIRLKSKLLTYWRNWKRGFDTRRYAVYPGAVFYIPHHAVDPFHSFLESPDEMRRMFERNGFSETNSVYHSKIAVFLSFVKG